LGRSRKSRSVATFEIAVRVWNPADPSRFAEVKALVDTGASYSWISRSRLEPLGVQAVRRQKFRTSEGRTVERDLVAVWVASSGFSGLAMVVAAECDDTEVIGVHTIEGLGLAVDPVQKRLAPAVGLGCRIR
jgi:predicted aspartyl protease